MNDIRRRRINELGEWEYECICCGRWLLKQRFKGCADKIDAYGNCFKCRSCISQDAKQTRFSNERKEVNELFILMGYDPYSDIPIHKQVEERHRIKYGGNTNNGTI